jgi:hypothetical protein
MVLTKMKWCFTAKRKSRMDFQGKNSTTIGIKTLFFEVFKHFR